MARSTLYCDVPESKRRLHRLEKPNENDQFAQRGNGENHSEASSAARFFWRRKLALASSRTYRKPPARLIFRYHSRLLAQRFSAAIGHVTETGGPFL
jgi:hypothetical protein